MSSGGFPLQVGAVASLFGTLDLLVVEVAPRAGGIALPPHARVVPLRAPRGQDLRRKLSIACGLPHYLGRIVAHVRAADVVHVPLPGDLPLLALVAAAALRRRVIARFCGSWAHNGETTRFDRLAKWLMRRLAGGRRVMLATGEGAAPPAPGMHWIFATALTRAELAGAPPLLARALARPPRLVYVGRLSPEKGVDRLLGALGRLAAAAQPLHATLVVAGDGPERPALERLVDALGLRDRVRFAGQLDRAALGAAVSAADVCVQPSLTEGFSKAWLDAMALGLPVIASDVGAARAVIGADGERGWIVPPGDVDALAAAIRVALEGPHDWPALRRRCRAFAESRTIEAWADEIGRRCAAQWGVAVVPRVHPA